MENDNFNSLATLKAQSGTYHIYRLDALEKAGLCQLDRIPYSVRILIESLLRQVNGQEITTADIEALANWGGDSQRQPEVPFLPARVIMQDFTGVPAIVDLAAMRAALHRAGGDPARINPSLPVDLVIDHSLQVDFFASQEALKRNAEMEFQRNQERYEFLRWGTEAFENFRVVPPATGIVHQVNLEYLANVTLTRQIEGRVLAFPDTLVGTDSHTTMINGLGVLGWGVGGIEAEAAILGQPMVLLSPQVVGFRLSGQLPEGMTATDLVLTITQMLRAHGVVGKFVEFYGSGLENLSLPDRATIANMAPEYGATVGFFPVDQETLRYLRFTGRDEALIDLVERYSKEQGLFRTPDSTEPEYNDSLELDMGTVQTSLAGPSRPQDRITLDEMQARFQERLSAPTNEGGYGLDQAGLERAEVLHANGGGSSLGHGSIVIAAITSCTNTSNPSVMLAAGLLAKKAIERGLRVKPFVKTSLAPGSRVVTEYLREADLLDPLAELGFNIVGYGCTTCIGNSGPLSGEIIKAVTENDLIVSAVLSGNRNFEGRISPYVRANFLASPPLVVAYAIAGTTDINLLEDPLGQDGVGEGIYLKDIWPSQDEIRNALDHSLSPEMFKSRYAEVYTGNPTWNEIPVSEGNLFDWDPASTYIQEPPFFEGVGIEEQSLQPILNARVLVLLGDSVTTDHISPAGAIPVNSPAGKFLTEHGVQPRDFNSFGSRRGNDRVMTRGTFGNIRLKNLLIPGVEGGETLHLPDGERMSIYEAAMKYKQEGVPLMVIAGKEYGSGSSRDWAAKGTSLLGVRAVIAESFERIHRSNLVGMGVLPLEFLPGENTQSLGLSGKELFSLPELDANLEPGAKLTTFAKHEDGSEIHFEVIARLDTPMDFEYYRNGGILHTVLRRIIGEAHAG